MRLKPRGFYKCLKKDTSILNYGVDDKYNIIPAKLHNQLDFIAEGIEVVLKSGRKHICTKDHLFKTENGWELPEVGKRIAVARKIHNPYVPIDEAEEYLMGLLVGDGCLRYNTPRLSCDDENILNKLIQDYKFQLKYVAQYDYNVLDFYDKVKECGLKGSNSWTKSIPKKYEGSPHFLRGLFDADGSVSKKVSSIIFVTVSEKLADDILRNLLYFGIVARKKYYKYPKSLKSLAVECYHISIPSVFLLNFEKHIGFISEHKKNQLRYWVDKLSSKTIHQTNIDTVPNSWKNFLKPLEHKKIRYEFGYKSFSWNKYRNSRTRVI